MEYLPRILAHSFDAIICFGDRQQVVVWNPEATRLFGLTEADALGRNLDQLSATQSFAGILPLVRSAHDGEQLQRFEQTISLPDSNKAVLDIVITRVSDDESAVAPAVAVILRDLTVTRRAQEAIRQGEERFQFLNNLGEATRALTAPEEIMATVTRLLGRHLRVSRCAYSDVEADSDHFAIRQDYTDGCASTVGDYRLALFGQRAVSDMLAGRTLVVCDVDRELAPAEGAEMFNAIGIKALICCPLAQDGRLRAMMAVHQTTPRDWAPHEITLVHEVVERCWSIIERARADAILRATEAMKGAILDTSLDGFILMNHEGRIVDWNKAAERIFGAKRGEVIGQPVGETIVPERLRENREELARYMASHDPSTLGTRYELPALRRDGSEFPSEISISHIPGTEPPLFARFVRDITERKRAEAALRSATEQAEAAAGAVAESAERFRLLAEVVSLQVWTAVPTGELDFANQECAQYLDVELDSGILGNNWTQFVHPEDLPEALRHWQHSVTTGERYETEFRLRRHDGVYRWFLVRAQAMQDPEGNVVKWFGSNTDIHDLKSAQGDAERANRTKDDFLAALSHELRTPLTPVLMTAAALRGDERLPPEAREQLGMMERNISLEARLIDDLLDLTRISRGQLHLRAQQCDAHSLIGLAVEIVRDDAMGKGISLQREFQAQNSGLTADPSRFQQLIWNLLRNSVKFTPRGGHILIRTCDEADGHLHIEVCDSGVGIEPAALDKIFLPFEQGGGEHRFGGMGLGLAIARAIVDLHGGTISARSEGKDRGATFSVDLPGAMKPPLGLTAPAHSTEWLTHGTELSEHALPSRAALRLLVVEDHESTLEVLSRLLTRAGHAVTAAGNLKDALAAASGGMFDLVISDLGLPDGTGNELMEILRARHGLRGIALSGYGMEEDIARSRQAGFSTHLTKPVDFPQLQRALREVTEGNWT
ncbi:MAG: PAS domain S-box protein [Chthoniobacterales bacterium]|nr:PAS domain S-box protein [Chthoniobacterales bacterium]